jgi:hypothetical protein
MWILREGPLEWGTKSESSRILWESYLSRRKGTFEPTREIRFELGLAVFGVTVESALAEARRCVASGGVRLHDIAVSALRLSRVQASFDKVGQVREGQLAFEGTLADVPAFPFPIEGRRDTVFGALLAASKAAHGIGLLADAIRETPDYWIFPARTTGCHGAFYDRRTERAVVMGSAFPIELWIWGYERGLLDPEWSEGNLVITEIRDRDRALPALRRLGLKVQRRSLDLPAVIEKGARWTEIPVLHEAGDSLAWHVEREPVTPLPTT